MQTEAAPDYAAGQNTTSQPQTEIDTEIKGEAIPPKGETQTPAVATARRIFIGAVQNLWLVWLVVALSLLIRKVTVYQGFVRYVKAGRSEVSDTDILDRLAVIGEQAGVKRPVELYTNSLVSSPLLLGFFRPCIVLPTADLPHADFEYIILHELTHYRRRDMFYKWLVQLTICLHWFNPLVYLMGREVSRACELACDEGVISKLDVKKQRAYGDTLLNAIATGGDYRDSLASMTLNESKELLKERLAAIMKFKKSTAMMVCISGLLAVGFLFGAAFAGAYQPEKIAPPTREAITEKTTLPNTTDEYSMTVYVGGQDISQEIIRLWHSANNIYNVDDSETFEMGESVFLFETGPEYCELLTYDVEVDDVFTGNGKLQLEQTR